MRTHASSTGGFIFIHTTPILIFSKPLSLSAQDAIMSSHATWEVSKELTWTKHKYVVHVRSIVPSTIGSVSAEAYGTTATDIDGAVGQQQRHRLASKQPGEPPIV